MHVQTKRDGRHSEDLLRHGPHGLLLSRSLSRALALSISCARSLSCSLSRSRLSPPTLSLSLPPALALSRSRLSRSLLLTLWVDMREQLLTKWSEVMANAGVRNNPSCACEIGMCGFDVC